MPATPRRPSPVPPGAAAPDDLGLFQGIVEHLGGVVLVCDQRGAVHWANSRAAEWLGAMPGNAGGAAPLAAAASPGIASSLEPVAALLTPLPGLDALALPWAIGADQLARVGAGETLRLRPDTLRGADGVVRRCHARLSPLPRSAAAPLVLLWIDEQVEDESASLSDTQRRRALASAQVGSWSRDFVDGAARVDPLWCYQLGLDPCEGPDHLERWLRRIHPDDVDRFRRASAEIEQAGDGAPDFDVEYRILTADSRWLWLLQRGRVSRRDPTRGTPLEAAGICIDIDARKRAEVEVHENESRLATALWGAQAAFWQLHVPSDIATRSPLWYAMTGYTREQWDTIPQPWTSRLHPEDRPEIDRLVAEHFEGRSQSLELRYRMRCADGRWKWMMDRGRVVEWDFDGRPIVAIGVSLDIDRQKRAELELLTSERRLETAIWGAGVGLYELDCASGATRWLNDWCERFDIDPCAGPEHVDRWDSNIHPEDLPAARARFTGHLEGREEYYDAEYRIRTRGGDWRWIFERGRVTERAAGGEPLRLVGTCMDIDARRRVELTAEDSRRRLELALEGAQGCLWEWDRARAQYNDAYYELHGVDPAEGRTQPLFWSDRAHPEDRERVLAAEREVIEGRAESHHTQYRVRHADGTWRWMVDRFRVAARDESGQATGLIGFAIDVTEDVRVREALEASESALRAVTQSAPDAMFLLDRELRIRFVNHGTRGESLDHLLGEHVLERVDPAQRPRLLAYFERVLREGEPVEFDLLLTHRSVPGPEVSLLNRVTAVRDGQGAVTGLAVVVTDVTAQRDAQLELQRAAQTLRTVTANTSDWLMLLDRERRIQFVNRPIRGFVIEKMIGRDALELVGPDHVEALRAAIERVQATGHPQALMQRVPSSELRGSRHIEVWVTPAQQGEAIVGTVLTLVDVTERVRQQQALVAQGMILETMNEAVLLVDLQDVAKLANPAFERLAGRGREALLGQSLATLLRESVAEHGAIVAAARAHWREHAPHVPLRREFDWRRPDGEVRRVAGSFSRLEVDGEPHVLCVYNDLTEQREVERRILDVVQRTQRRIGADLHDGLGQELTGISMLLRSLHAGAAAGAVIDDARLGEVVALVSRSIETAHAMSRGLAPVDPEHGGLRGALQRLVEAATRQSGVRVELRFELPASLQFSAEQSTHLLRIAQEAVSNALRHGEPRSIVVAVSSDGEYATLAVSDDGRGFPDDHDPQRGLGLKTVRYRASVLRGDLQILRQCAHAPHGPGITLICRVPVHSRGPSAQ